MAMWIIFYPEADGSIDWDAIVAAKRDIDKGHKAGLLSDTMAA
jgi:hypothetical protein